HDTTDLHQLLPLAAVACEARYFPRRNRSHPPQANFGDHAFKPGPFHATGGRAPEVLVHDLDLAPAQLAQTRLHRVLQLLTLGVVSNLEVGRLTDVEHSLALQVVCLDLFTHRAPPRC